MTSIIVLVGLPGAGKSTAAAGLANALGWAHLDIDAEIERRTGKQVSEIFGESGEPYFRRLERDVSQELVNARRTVVAAGGGWMSNLPARALLQPVARIIYLRVTPATALARLGDTSATRPLLSGTDALGRLERLYRARRSDYEGADAVLDVETIGTQEVTAKLVALAEKFDIIR